MIPTILKRTPVAPDYKFPNRNTVDDEIVIGLVRHDDETQQRLECPFILFSLEANGYRNSLLPFLAYGQKRDERFPKRIDEGFWPEWHDFVAQFQMLKLRWVEAEKQVLQFSEFHCGAFFGSEGTKSGKEGGEGKGETYE